MNNAKSFSLFIGFGEIINDPQIIQKNNNKYLKFNIKVVDGYVKDDTPIYSTHLVLQLVDSDEFYLKKEDDVLVRGTYISRKIGENKFNYISAESITAYSQPLADVPPENQVDDLPLPGGSSWSNMISQEDLLNE